MNFRKLTDDIMNFIESNFESDLQLNFVKDGAIDLDRYKTENTVFFDFESFTFEHISNLSDLHTIKLNMHLVCKNGTPSELKNRIMALISAFYDFFQNNQTLGRTVDNLLCESVNFYLEPNGNKAITIATMSISLKVEEQK